VSECKTCRKPIHQTAWGDWGHADLNDILACPGFPIEPAPAWTGAARHITDAELGRRIAANYDERTATHQAMLAPGLTPRVPVLSEEWAQLGARYDALAAQSAALYAELTRRDREAVNA
jgi:hypothetical protein